MLSLEKDRGKATNKVRVADDEMPVAQAEYQLRAIASQLFASAFFILPTKVVPVHGQGKQRRSGPLFTFSNTIRALSLSWRFNAQNCHHLRLSPAARGLNRPAGSQRRTRSLAWRKHLS